MKRLLITGASGFLGWNLCRDAARSWKVFGTVLSHPVEMRGVEMIRSDLTDSSRLGTIFEAVRPDAVIHTAAASNANFCQLNRAASHRINVDASVALAGLCAERSIPYVFTSSDLVFDGLKAPYREEDPASPVNVYGEQKAIAEEAILRRYPNAAICRMPLMFGEPSPAADSFIQSMIRNMKEGRELKLFIDEFRTPTSGAAAVRGILLSLERVSGIIHLGGCERISRYDFGLLLADVLSLDNAVMTPCLQSDVAMAAPRPHDVSFDSTRAFNLGYRPAPLRKELEDLLPLVC